MPELSNDRQAPDSPSRHHLLPCLRSLRPAAYYLYASVVAPRRLASNTLLLIRDMPKPPDLKENIQIRRLILEAEKGAFHLLAPQALCPGPSFLFPSDHDQQHLESLRRMKGVRHFCRHDQHLSRLNRLLLTTDGDFRFPVKDIYNSIEG